MTRPLVLIDERLPVAAALLAPHAALRPFPGRALGGNLAGLAEAEALVVRNTARVDEEAFAAAPRLKVVASR